MSGFSFCFIFRIHVSFLLTCTPPKIKLPLKSPLRKSSSHRGGRKRILPEAIEPSPWAKSNTNRKSENRPCADDTSLNRAIFQRPDTHRCLLGAEFEPGN